MQNQSKYQVIVIGGSAGAMTVLVELLPAFPADFPLPIVIAVHLHPRQDNAHIERLASQCALSVKEADEKKPIQVGSIYLAPPNYHLLIENDRTFSLSIDERVNYAGAGGTRSFGDYYHAKYESAIMNPSLKSRVTFASHNLATDGVFGELHVIFCRNVLIYFDRELQNRVLGLFADSLAPGGFLCLGSKETLLYSDMADRFKVVDERAKIFQKRVV